MIYDIRMQHFRSYEDESFEFNPAVTIIVGPNASGKTNLLEAILVLARGSSYRARDADLVSFGSDWCRLDAQMDMGERIVKLTPNQLPKKEFVINDKKFLRLSINRTIPIVLFEPNHLRLLSGSPERRRTYLDELLMQLDPAYGQNLRRYKQALAQRNALLKQRQHDISDQLFPWNIKLSQLGGALAASRNRLVEDMAEPLNALYRIISHTDTNVTFRYESTCGTSQYESTMLHHLDANLAVDRERGFTGFGPHRDDLAILFNGRPSSLVASRGESRTVVLALKVLELQKLEQVREQKPLLLLDDVFSELDGARRLALTDYLSRYQTFITTTDADIALASFGKDCTVIPLANS